MLYRAKEWARNTLIRLLMATKTDLSALVKVDLRAEDFQSSYIVNSSIIIKLWNESETRYFRECYPHQALKPYLMSALHEYFNTVCRGESKEAVRRAVLLDLQKKSNYRKFIRMGNLFNAHLIEILSGRFCDYAAVGLPSFAQKDWQDDFISLIKYSNCVIINQRINCHLSTGKFQNNSANKQLATYELAKLLGIERLVPRVEMCRLSTGASCKIGTLMENAPGVAPSTLQPEDRADFDKATFLNDVTTLEYFDALCYQLDHRLDNYNVVRDEQGKIARVVAFDNDANRTFFAKGSLPRRTYASVGCILKKNGTMNRPCMDKAFAHRLCALQKKDVRVAVGVYMSAFQLHALWRRIKLLRKAALYEAKRNDGFFVSDWSLVPPDTVADEGYGKTYFNLYLNDTLMLDREKMFSQLKESKE